MQSTVVSSTTTAGEWTVWVCSWNSNRQCGQTVGALPDRCAAVLVSTQTSAGKCTLCYHTVLSLHTIAACVTALRSLVCVCVCVWRAHSVKVCMYGS